ncbi:MAG TPA: YncE family protein [Candidatus Aminicenantes bacterium]|nr:YncE family protein [Candidatus Aminicenantes bacterium]
MKLKTTPLNTSLKTILNFNFPPFLFPRLFLTVLLILLLIPIIPALAESARPAGATTSSVHPIFALPTPYVFVNLSSASAPGFHLLKKYVIVGEGGWDYLALEVNSRLLYITHGNSVEILNVDTGIKLPPITGLKGVHGVTFAPQKGLGYISNGRSNTVSVFVLKTYQVVKEIPVSGQNPDAILYDQFSDRLFTFNGRSADATVIDPATDKILATLPLGGKPEFAVSDNQGTIYVNIEDKSEVVAFDARSLQIKKRWSIAPGQEPSGLAIDLKNQRLFSVCDKILVISDAAKGQVVATVPIGRGPDAVRYDPKLALVFSSNGDGTLTIVQQIGPDKYAVLETVKTAPRARTMELDPKTHHLFLATAEFGPAPAPTKDQPHPHPQVIPGSFMVLEFGNL